MTYIDLDVDVLKNISYDIEASDNTLNSDYFVKMKNFINELLSEQGIKTDEVRSILTSINEKVEFYQNEIKTNLTGLEETISNSLNQYTIVTEQALTKLKALLNMMQNFNKNGTFDFSTVNSLDSYMTSETTNSSGEMTDTTDTEDSEDSGTAGEDSTVVDAISGADPKVEGTEGTTQEAAEEFNFWQTANSSMADNTKAYWENYLNSMETYYQNTADSHGAISAVANALVDTITLPFEFVGDTLEFAMNEVINGAQWVGQVSFGAIDSIFGFNTELDSKIINWIF